jgi:phosphoglycerate kinase
MLGRSLRNVVSNANIIAIRGYKKTIDQLAKQKPNLLQDCKVLVRVDFNVPLSKTDSSIITDDTRIREALPTINFLTNAGAKVMLASHCGRPDGKVNEKMRMAPMAKRLSELLKKPVATVGDCIGADVDAAAAKMVAGDILMLENTRFYKEEEKNVPDFASKMAKNATVFVNDAFGTAHRAHASTEGVCKFVDYKVAGFLLEKEIKFLKGAVDAPKRPFAAIVGGAKVSTKIPVIESLIEKCDKIFIGGGMIFTFYRAMGLDVGKSMVEEEFIPMAKALMEKAAAKGVKFILPTDVVVADAFKADAQAKNVSVKEIPAEWMGLDIGAQSLETFKAELANCKTVVWNGPMGVFEFEKFAQGTFGVAHALAEITDKGGITIIGGGDSVAAVSAAHLEHRMSHISTGGGASLEMLEGKVLPGVAALDDA